MTTPMTTPKVTEDQFLKDVDKHVMTVLKDDGLYRHLRFKKTDTSDMLFDLITWPGSLCYTGDMGTFVFSRTADMFTFFRSDSKWNNGRTVSLYIKPGYWSEKLEAVDRTDGFQQYSPEKVREHFTEWMEDHSANTALRQAIENHILSCLDEGPQAVHNATTDFQYDGENPFQNFWEVSMDEYTGRFIWCCYALAWGIQEYDAVSVTIGRDRNR